MPTSMGGAFLMRAPQIGHSRGSLMTPLPGSKRLWIVIGSPQARQRIVSSGRYRPVVTMRTPAPRWRLRPQPPGASRSCDNRCDRFRARVFDHSTTHLLFTQAAVLPWHGEEHETGVDEQHGAL